MGIPQELQAAVAVTRTPGSSDSSGSDASPDVHGSSAGAPTPAAAAAVPVEGTAPAGQLDTGALMPHGLDTRYRTAARIAGIRAPYPGVDTLAHVRRGAGVSDADRTDSPDAGEPLAPVVHLADRAPRPARDGGTRHGQAAPIDAQNHVSLGKALSALGWDQRTLLGGRA
jgi:hypothetical protein